MTDMRGKSPVALSVVRIFDSRGEAVGAGFVVGPGRVATCAHVVTAAVGGDPTGQEPPSARVRLDLPLLAGSPAAGAMVRAWQPIDPATGAGDVAILETDPALTGQMPPLYRPDDLWGHRFRVLGFPVDMQDGVWTAGELRDRQGTRWLQIQGDPQGPPIAAGFSGAPVWDDDVGAVVGMTVATDVDPASTTAYLVPIEAAIGIDPRLLPNPYRGLEPFGEEHADLYCGRDDEVVRLAALVDQQPLVAVVGRSGTGKSSLVRAGLLPRLRRRGARIVYLRATPLTPSLDALLADVLGDPGRTPEGSGVAATASDVATGDGGGRREVIVFADQFEELIGVPSADGRPAPAQDLLLRLAELVRTTPGLRVLLTLRWEAMNDLLTGDTVETFEQGTFSLAPMTRDQLRRAVIEPAARAPGLAFADGLVERILDDAADEPGGLPLVEFLLTRLWETRDGGTLEMAAYQQLGGVRGAVTRQAEQHVAELAEHTDEAAIRRVLTVLVRPDDSLGFVRRPVPVDLLDDDQRAVVDHLARGRLVVVGQQPDGTPTVELAHQALIDHWPRLRDWLAEDREFLVWLHQVANQRQAWEATARDPDALLRGMTLSLAEDWVKRRGTEVDARERAFVTASRRRERRESRRRRSLVAALGVVVVLALVLGTLLTSQRRATGREQAMSDSRALAALSSDTAATDPASSIMLALAAHDLHPTPEAENAMFRQFVTHHATTAVLSGAQGDIAGVDASRDGRVVVTRALAGVVTVWHREPGQPVRSEAARVGTAFAFDLSDDGRRLLVAGRSTVEVYDVGRWSSPAWGLPVAGPDVVSMALADDGTVALRLSADPGRDPGSLELWSPDGRLAGRHHARAGAALNPILGVGPGGDTVVAVDIDPDGDEGQRVTAWNAETGAVDTVVDGIGGTAVMTGDGVIVACTGDASHESVVRVDLRDGTRRSLALPTGASCTLHLAVDADASIAVVGDIVVDLATGNVTGSPRALSEGGASVGPVITDGDRLSVVRANSSAVVITEVSTEPGILPAERLFGLDLEPGPYPTGLPPVLWAGLLPDGRHVLTVTGDASQLVVSRKDDGAGRSAALRDVVASADRPAPRRWVGTTGLNVSGDGTLVADRVAAQTIQVRRLPGLELVSEATTTPVGDDDANAWIGWWPDGRLVASDRQQTQWWDPASGELVAELTSRDIDHVLGESAVQETSLTSYPDDPDLAVIGAVGDPDLHLVDITSGDEVGRVPVGDDVLAATFRPDSSYVALLRRGSRVEVWDHRTDRRVLGPFPPLAEDHPGDFVSTFLTAEGSYFVGDGGRLLWYEVGSAAPVRRLDLPDPELVPISVSEDGSVVLVVDHRRYPTVLPPLALDPDVWRARLCDVVDDREFTDTERELLPPAVADRPVC